MMKKIQDAGFRIAEVPVHHYHRAFGKSQFFNFRRIVTTGVDVLRLWFALVIAAQPRRRRRRAPVAAAGPGDHRPPSHAAHVTADYREFYRGRARDDHRRPRLHRQQPGARSWSISAPTCCSSIR